MGSKGAKCPTGAFGSQKDGIDQVLSRRLTRKIKGGKLNFQEKKRRLLASLCPCETAFEQYMRFPLLKSEENHGFI